jgi:hypothetical protein
MCNAGSLISSAAGACSGPIQQVGNLIETLAERWRRSIRPVGRCGRRRTRQLPYPGDAGKSQQIHHGETLLRALDCERDHGPSQRGRLPWASGRSAGALPAAWWSIQTSPAAGETYHVTVAMPKLADGRSCLVGRTGFLNFDDDTPDNADTAN